MPGTGKTTLAKLLAKSFKTDFFCDKDFLSKKEAKKKEIEYGLPVNVVDLPEFAKHVNSKLAGKKDFILDGLIFPYVVSRLKFKLDVIIVLKLNEAKLTSLLKARKYPLAKIWDNLFVQETCSLEAEIDRQVSKMRKKPSVFVIELSSNLSKNKAIILNLVKGVKNI